ncbi:Ribonuclease II [Forsythia ovata]|uniref:Ribonuclease II n=1 Tax=Forsythia ovata TaxID=205694 RepID=A0ABD1S3Q2_9LAMI
MERSQKQAYRELSCPQAALLKRNQHYLPQILGLELKSSEELLENKSGKQMLQKGLLLEFKKDPEKVLLAVAQKPDGKNGKNIWMVSDQDLTLLEFTWIELLEKNKSVRVKELAEMVFGTAEPFESYCAHLLLSNDDIYFTILESKCSFSVYGPRPAVQVDELLLRKHAKKAAEKEFKEFVKLLKSTRNAIAFKTRKIFMED